MTMLITDELRALLLANGRQALADEEFDPLPVVKLFTPDAGATWLLDFAIWVSASPSWAT